VHLSHRCAAVRLRATEGRCEELNLLALEPGHVGAAEEACQSVVGQNAVVEVGDNGFQRLMPADLFIDACHAPSQRRPGCTTM
jgi:hypothetical protein